jgi:hypothetical protein
MQIQLIQGEFNSREALELMSKMIQTKIASHEYKISSHLNEEDIKYRETKIKFLQNELMQVRSALINANKYVVMNANLQIA